MGGADWNWRILFPVKNQPYFPIRILSIYWKRWTVEKGRGDSTSTHVRLSELLQYKNTSLEISTDLLPCLPTRPDSSWRFQPLLWDPHCLTTMEQLKNWSLSVQGASRTLVYCYRFLFCLVVPMLIIKFKIIPGRRHGSESHFLLDNISLPLSLEVGMLQIHFPLDKEYTHTYKHTHAHIEIRRNFHEVSYYPPHLALAYSQIFDTFTWKNVISRRESVKSLDTSSLDLALSYIRH